MSEIIIATNPNTEGDVTLHIWRSFIPYRVKVTRLARPPAGSDL